VSEDTGLALNHETAKIVSKTHFMNADLDDTLLAIGSIVSIVLRFVFLCFSLSRVAVLRYIRRLIIESSLSVSGWYVCATVTCTYVPHYDRWRHASIF